MPLPTSAIGPWSTAIWDVGRGFQLSGLYFYGSGMRTAVTCGSCQVRDTGQAAGTRRRDDGSIIERNSFVGTAAAPCRHAVPAADQRSAAADRIDGILEVFNLFDYANFGSFTNDVDSPLYGQPVYNPDVAYGSLIGAARVPARLLEVGRGSFRGTARCGRLCPRRLSTFNMIPLRCHRNFAALFPSPSGLNTSIARFRNPLSDRSHTCPMPDTRS